MNYPAAFLMTARRWCRAAVGLMVVLSALSGSRWPAVAQDGVEAQQRNREGNARANIAVLVIPLGAETARVALNYRTKITHRRVKEEIEQLARAAGGKIEGKIRIEDYSLNPENLQRFPVTTSALFTLTNAPQFQDAEPRVLSYLQAFRRSKSLDVLVQIAGGISQSEPQRFQSAEMIVWLYREPTMLRYHAEIAEGNQTLPMPAFVETKPNGTETPPAAAEPSRGGTPILPMILIVAGVALVGGAGFYLVSTRRATSKTSPRTGLM